MLNSKDPDEVRLSLRATFRTSTWQRPVEADAFDGNSCGPVGSSKGFGLGSEFSVSQWLEMLDHSLVRALAKLNPAQKLNKKMFFMLKQA